MIRTEIPAHRHFQTPSKSRRTTENFQAEVLDNNKTKKILVVLRRGGAGGGLPLLNWKVQVKEKNKKFRQENKTLGQLFSKYFFPPCYLSPSLPLSVFV